MPSIDVQPNAALNSFLATRLSGNQKVRIAFRRGLRVIQSYAQDHNNLPRPGDEDHIDTRIVSETPELHGQVFVEETSIPWAKYFHFGTGLYGPKKKAFTIVPKTRKVLRWSHGDKFIFARKVTIKGIRGEPFLDNAVKAKGAEALEIVSDAVLNEFGVKL